MTKRDYYEVLGLNKSASPDQIKSACNTVISDIADFEYKCTDYYDPSDEGSLFWNDPHLNIPWPIDTPKLSEKDANAPLLADIKK